MQFQFALLPWAINRAYADFAREYPHLPLPPRYRNRKEAIL